MYQKHFAEYYLSEKDLKAKINSILKNLNIFAPIEFSNDIIENINSNESTEVFLQNLMIFIPIIKNLEKDLSVLEAETRLRVVAINLDIILFTKRLEYLLPKLIGMTFSSQLLGFRYIVASLIIEQTLAENLRYDSNAIIQNLMNPFNGENQTVSKFSTAILAEEEISRITVNEKANIFFENLIENFEVSIENYVNQNLPDVIYETFNRIFFEAVVTNLNFIAESFSLENSVVSENKSDLSKIISGIVRKGTSFRMGIQRGGKREKKGFMWTKQNKISFYKQVMHLPKIADKPMWEYALNELMEKNFDFYIEEYLKNKTPFRDVPKKLFTEAIKIWKKYKDDLVNMKPQDKPRAFEFLHALYLLEYPQITFSTSVKYFTQGKKLSEFDK